ELDFGHSPVQVGLVLPQDHELHGLLDSFHLLIVLVIVRFRELVAPPLVRDAHLHEDEAAVFLVEEEADVAVALARRLDADGRPSTLRSSREVSLTSSSKSGNTRVSQLAQACSCTSLSSCSSISSTPSRVWFQPLSPLRTWTTVCLSPQTLNWYSTRSCAAPL